jgi:hypothetical protein
MFNFFCTSHQPIHILLELFKLGNWSIHIFYMFVFKPLFNLSIPRVCLMQFKQFHPPVNWPLFSVILRADLWSELKSQHMLTWPLNIVELDTSVCVLLLEPKPFGIRRMENNKRETRSQSKQAIRYERPSRVPQISGVSNSYRPTRSQISPVYSDQSSDICHYILGEKGGLLASWFYTFLQQRL